MVRIGDRIGASAILSLWQRKSSHETERKTKKDHTLGIFNVNSIQSKHVCHVVLVSHHHKIRQLSEVSVRVREGASKHIVL